MDIRALPTDSGLNILKDQVAVLRWTETLSVGVPAFDYEHKRLVAMLNELGEAFKYHEDKVILGKTIKNLINYTITHFSNEERAMQEYNYPQYKEHKYEHDAFVDKCTQMKHAYDEGEAVFTQEVLDFLMDWVQNHIMRTDKMYSKYFMERGMR